MTQPAAISARRAVLPHLKGIGEQERMGAGGVW